MGPAIRSSATHRVAASKEAYKALFHESYERSDTRMILRNGVPLSPFESPRVLDLRKELGLPQEARLIGHVGRMIPSKNHEFLIAVFAEMRRSEPRTELILVGDGPLRAAISTRAAQMGVSDHVHFLGTRGDVPRILSNLDGFVFPSLYEGVPLAVVEAQAAGIVCAASTTISSEVDIGCGLVQFLDLKDEPAKWAAVVGSHLRSRIRAPWDVRCASLRSSGYDIEDVVRQWMRIYSASEPCVA